MEGKGIYQNGLSAKQFNCHIILQDDNLHIYLEDEKNELLIWNLRTIHSCHLNGSSLIVKYGDYPHQTLECIDPLANAIYQSWSGNKVVRMAEGFAFKQKHLSVILFTLIFIILCFSTWFYFLPWVGEKAAALVPKEVEIEMGESLSTIYAQENRLNDSASYYITEFTKRLKLVNTYPLQVRVITSEEINAFALPGGKIFVYSGIIEKMETYEELVALLGHEVTHVSNRHSLKSICRSAASSIVIASLFGDVTGISSGILSQADQFKQLDYSRELETEADNNGLNIMIQNKISPEGMLQLLKLLKEESAEMPQMMKYLSTHPDTDSRIRNISSNSQAKTSFPANEELEQLFKLLQNSILKAK
jgi:beta-barrel assembly-enhancing protease